MGLAVGVVTIGGRLHLVFRYRYPLFGQAEVTDFAERYWQRWIVLPVPASSMVRP